jgi:hypothetical protein
MKLLASVLLVGLLLTAGLPSVAKADSLVPAVAEGTGCVVTTVAPSCTFACVRAVPLNVLGYGFGGEVIQASCGGARESCTVDGELWYCMDGGEEPERHDSQGLCTLSGNSAHVERMVFGICDGDDSDFAKHLRHGAASVMGMTV